VRAAIEAHLKAVSAGLPVPQRVKVWHLFDGELPRTATRKVKRPWVREELLRLEAASRTVRKALHVEPGGAGQAGPGGDGWVLDLVAEIARRPRAEVTPASRLSADLGFDSLMLTELASALEVAGVPATSAEALLRAETAGELARIAAGSRRATAALPPALAAAGPAKEGTGELAVPATVASLGRAVLGAAQKALYERLYQTRVTGRAFVPHDRNVLVVANHASHLDMGLVKVAMAEEGDRLAALAARDYFFDTPLKRAYFGNFTNLIPMDRSGSLKRSLRAALTALSRGYHLLIFPEGTRTRDGSLGQFYPTAGYLALHGRVDVLPAWLAGTHEALPPGAALPRRADLEVRFGEVLRLADLEALGAGLPRNEAYKRATRVMEEAVRRLGDPSHGAAPRPTGQSPSGPHPAAVEPGPLSRSALGGPSTGEGSALPSQGLGPLPNDDAAAIPVPANGDHEP